MSDTGYVSADLGLNVRAGPSTSTAKLGLLPKGSRVEIVGSSGTWSRIAMYHDPTAVPVLSGWVASTYLDTTLPPPPPPPPAAAGVRVGLNVLNRHEEVALPAARAGCRYFIVLNNPGFASRLKREYPDAVVMARIYWDKRIPSVDELISRMDGCRDPGLIYTGLNEADECPQDEDGIRRRAEFDVAVARRIKAISGAVYAAGTFSMGTPDFTRDSVCQVMREVYAPHYNSGLISWDHHLYTPNMAYGPAPRSPVTAIPPRIVERPVGKAQEDASWEAVWNPDQRSLAAQAWIDPIWFETRWRFLFTACGFDPRSPSRIYCSETGIDEGGVGGFPAHGAAPADVVRWAKWWRAIQAEGIGGAPSPMIGGAIFQVGNREDWAGYNVEYAYGALADEVWR